MRRRFATLLLFSIGCTSVMGAPVTYELSQGGAKIGTCVYDRKADGTFVSTTNIDVASMKITHKLSGRFEKGKLVEFVAEGSDPRSTFKITNKNGKVTAVLNGKEQPSGKVDLAAAVYANYHPGLASTIFASLSQSSIQGARPIKISILDGGGTVMDTMVTPRDPRKVMVDGKEVTLRPFVVSITGIDVEYVVDSDGEIVGENVPVQKVTMVVKGYENAFEDPVAKYKELSQPTYKVKVLKGEKIKMRDGVTLVHDIALPEGDEKFPTILMRTPYGRATGMGNAEWWAKRGYVTIVQDCRGRHDSEGAWDPFVAERKDGKDTIDWIEKQRWSDGKVGMIGASYGGYVQWAAAVEHPAALKCIVPQVSPPDAMRNIPYEFGAFSLWPNLWWANIVRDKITRLDRASQPLPNLEKLATLPLSKVDDEVLGVNVPFFDEWLKRDGMNKWAKTYDTISDMPSVDIPALHISGWWDGDGVGTKLNWATMRQAGRTNQWLIYGPWSHAFNTSTKFGDVDYGSGSILELDSVYLRWFDTWLKGKEVGFNGVPKVQAFLTGANRWLKLGDWPAKDTTEKKMYLVDGKTLADQPVENGKSVSYTYDPKKEASPDKLKEMMASGGTTLAKPGDTNDRQLVYRSAPLVAEMAITGPISVDLYFSTDVVSTDFYALLYDIDEKGVTHMIGMPGKIDVRYLDGLGEPVLITPGKVYKAHIQLWDTAHLFKKGHRMGLHIVSSTFPMFARNLNTGEPIYGATKMKVARQTIYQDRERPSSLSFQVLPDKP